MMNPKIESWQGLRVWVIGASTGIGAATAQLLVAKGARVAVSARSFDKLQTVVGDSPNALVLPLDITAATQVQHAHDAVLAAWGRVDVYLIVAGGYTPMGADNFDLTAARTLVDLNINGVLNALAVALPQLKKQGAGAIAIVSSVAGYRGLPRALIYGPTKAALINMAECLYLELNPQGIGVHVINPGFVKTPLTAQNDFKMPALITPEVAAAALLRGLERGQFEITFPHRFTVAVKLVSRLPYRMYFWLIRRTTGL